MLGSISQHKIIPQWVTLKARRSFRLDHVLFFRGSWMVIIYFQEYQIYASFILRCVSRPWVKLKTPVDAVIALIADPQLVDENTYNRRGLLLALTKFYTDRYMRRNYRLLHDSISLNRTIFLGDLFDGGREWADPKWSEELARFRHVFPAIGGHAVELGVPGNHDIGFAEGIDKDVYHRFQDEFGPTSKSIRLGAWDLILLDGIGLSSPDIEVSGKSRNFMNSLPLPDSPRLLILHVPLYRPPDAPCGPLRESLDPIKIQRGHQYQNVLDFDVSSEIWEKVQPQVVFAGDDHDYCDYLHENGVHVINVKSFSWAMGVQYPGFSLVGLSMNQYESKACKLPSQVYAFKVYGIFAFCTIVLVAVSKYGDFIRHDLSILRKGDDLEQPSHKKRASSRKRLPWEYIGSLARITWFVFLWYLLMLWW